MDWTFSLSLAQCLSEDVVELRASLITLLFSRSFTHRHTRILRFPLRTEFCVLSVAVRD